MLYHIKGLCPGKTDAGFTIELWPRWKEGVAAAGLKQKNIQNLIQTMGRVWLDGCGYTAIFDPDNCGVDKDETKPPGPKSRPLYGIESIHVQWGEWGPEHITVPGDACGLDIATSFATYGGRTLYPHNVDTIRQAHLLLIVFTFIADEVVHALTHPKQCS
jgi:hypothetical protein